MSALKQVDGPDIQVQGSANLLQTLIGSDLVDEFRIWTFPVVVGSGKRLFDDGTVPHEFELLSSEAFDTGVILATYLRAGAVAHGSFAFEDPTGAEVERRRKLSGGGGRGRGWGGGEGGGEGEGVRDERGDGGGSS